MRRPSWPSWGRSQPTCSPRAHDGISPFTGTSLDALLRNLDVTTVVGAGVSVNLGVLGLCVEAVNLGYHVVVASDAVAGVPGDYADEVMRTRSRCSPPVGRWRRSRAQW